MKDIVITAGTAVGSVLALVEAITEKFDCKVYVLCSNKEASKVISSSKLVYDVVYISDEVEISYIKEIKKWYKIISFSEIPILYFTTDNSCFYIDNNREWFESNFKLCLPSSEIIQIFTEKGRAEIKAFESGVKIPKTHVVKSVEDLNMVISEFDFPVILKPRATYLKGDLDFKIKVIESKVEFKKVANDFIESNNFVLCQEFIPGGDDDSYYYLFYRNKDGDIFESIGKKILQSTPAGGKMLKGLSEYDVELSIICKDFLRNIDYQGIGGIEFKKHNNNYYFIEMSVRLEGFFKISEIAETPLSLISYYDIATHNIPDGLRFYNQKDGYYYIDFVSTFARYFRYRELMPAIFDIIHMVFNTKYSLNILSMKNIKPFLYQIIILAKRIVK